MNNWPAFALTGARILAEDHWLDSHAITIADGRIQELVPQDRIPSDLAVHDLGGGLLLPGFIDTQVNGGGGVLFNSDPSVEGIRAIAEAHRRHGTTGLLPTVISDTPDTIQSAIAATSAAIGAGVPGVLGIHIEGPYLNAGKRGIHNERHFGPLDAEALTLLTSLANGRTLVTIAPELAPPGAIERLVEAGVVVSAGHSMASYAQMREAIGKGLRGATHLFNAMTNLTAREPGMVGAVLDDRSMYYGIILDGIHVHPASLRIALAAGDLRGAMLVSDGMPPAGSDQTTFFLGDKEIHVEDGACRDAEGTLAGSALTMDRAFRNAIEMLGLDMIAASRIASGNPAAFLGLEDVTGRIRAGLQADLVLLDEELHVKRTWICGV